MDSLVKNIVLFMTQYQQVIDGFFLIKASEFINGAKREISPPVKIPEPYQPKYLSKNKTISNLSTLHISLLTFVIFLIIIIIIHNQLYRILTAYLATPSCD